MTSLPTMTTAEAIKARVQRFQSIRPCKCCGCRERYLTTWGNAGVVCVGCESLTGPSLGKINADMNRHNRKVAKMKRANWCIPVVFGGMSTNTR